jgi:dihydrofolate reductase
MEISLIVAKAIGDVIGVNNQLPWHLSDDLKRFKALTMGKPILMGRKTYESIGKPLPGRTNIILTHNREYTAPSCVVVYSIEEALNYVKNELSAEELMVIGGEKVYVLCLPYATQLYITQIEKMFEGDAKFPKIDLSKWQEIDKQFMPANEVHAFDYHYLHYKKIK